MKRIMTMVFVATLCGCPEPPPTETARFATVDLADTDMEIVDVMNAWLKEHKEMTVTRFALYVESSDVERCLIEYTSGTNTHQCFSTMKLPKSDEEKDIFIMQKLSEKEDVYGFDYLPHSPSIDEFRYLLVCKKVSEETEDD